MDFAAICLINLINLMIFNQTFSMLNKIRYCIYSGKIWPQGLYKIVIWDRQIYPISEQCEQIFVELQKEVQIDNRNTLFLHLRMFRYKHGQNLDEMANCFQNFTSVESDREGEFSVKLSSKFLGAIFVHIFPLNDEKSLLRLAENGHIILQNVYRKKDWVYFRRHNAFYFYNFAERTQKMQGMLERWLHDDHFTDCDAFFLKAYLYTFGSNLVRSFVNKAILQPYDLEQVQKYGAEMRKFQKSGGNLTQKLVKIDGMPKLMENLCNFIIFENQMISLKWKDGTEANLVIWAEVCQSLGKERKPKKSILENKIWLK